MAKIQQPEISEQITDVELPAAPQFEVLTSDVESQVEENESIGEKSNQEKTKTAGKTLEKIQSSEAVTPGDERVEVKVATLAEKKGMLVEKFTRLVTVARDPIAAAEEIFSKARTKYLAKYPDMVKDMYIEIMDRLDKAYESGRGRASGSN